MKSIAPCGNSVWVVWLTPFPFALSKHEPIRLGHWTSSVCSSMTNSSGGGTDSLLDA
jgi:hypothetical protein